MRFLVTFAFKVLFLFCKGSAMSAAIADHILFANMTIFRGRKTRSGTGNHQMFSCNVSFTWQVDRKCCCNIAWPLKQIIEMAAQLSQSSFAGTRDISRVKEEIIMKKKKTQINDISWKCLMITQELTSFRILFSNEIVKDILYILWYFRKMTQYSAVVKNDVKSTAWIVLGSSARLFNLAVSTLLPLTHLFNWLQLMGDSFE